MMELPEAYNLAKQIEQTLAGKRIASAVANHSPHKFAWYHGDPAAYGDLLAGRRVEAAASHGGMVEVIAEGARMVLGDGAAPRFIGQGEKLPAKHQLLVEFEGGGALIASVQMYGGIWCFRAGEFDNPYYRIACEKPSPLSEEFDEPYFAGLINDNNRGKSAKAFLATEQCVPGLGNGVLQDILWNARIHPRRSMSSLTDAEFSAMFHAVRSTLEQMTEQGGRDTEKDLFGQPGGYITRLSKNTVGQPCPECGGEIMKEAYMGGSIYYCPVCQRR